MILGILIPRVIIGSGINSDKQYKLCLVGTCIFTKILTKVLTCAIQAISLHFTVNEQSGIYLYSLKLVSLAIIQFYHCTELPIIEEVIGHIFRMCNSNHHVGLEFTDCNGGTIKAGGDD